MFVCSFVYVYVVIYSYKNSCCSVHSIRASVMTSEYDRNDHWNSAQDARSFLRWINFQLVAKSKTVTDLRYDLSDGIIFVDLLECVASKSIAVSVAQHTTGNARKLKLYRIALVIEHMKAENVEACANVGKINYSVW